MVQAVFVDNKVPAAATFARNSVSARRDGTEVPVDTPRYMPRNVASCGRPSWSATGISPGATLTLLASGVDHDDETELDVVSNNAAETVGIYVNGVLANTFSRNMETIVDVPGTWDITFNNVHVWCGLVLFHCTYFISGDLRGSFFVVTQDDGFSFQVWQTRDLDGTQTVASDDTIGAMPPNSIAMALGDTDLSDSANARWAGGFQPIGDIESLTDAMFVGAEYLGNRSGDEPHGGLAFMGRITRQPGGQWSRRDMRKMAEAWDQSFGQAHWHDMGMFSFGETGFFAIAIGDGDENCMALLHCDIENYETGTITGPDYTFYGEQDTEKGGLQPVAFVPTRDGGLVGSSDTRYIKLIVKPPTEYGQKAQIDYVDRRVLYTAQTYYQGNDPLHLRFYPHKYGPTIVGGAQNTLPLGWWHISRDCQTFARVPVGDAVIGDPGTLMLSGRRLASLHSGEIYKADMPGFIIASPPEIAGGGFNHIRPTGEDFTFYSGPGGGNTRTAVYRNGDEYRQLDDDVPIDIQPVQHCPDVNNRFFRLTRTGGSVSFGDIEVRENANRPNLSGPTAVEIWVYNLQAGGSNISLMARALSGSFTNSPIRYFLLDSNNGWERFLLYDDDLTKGTARMLITPSARSGPADFLICINSWVEGQYVLPPTEGQATCPDETLSIASDVTGSTWSCKFAVQWPDQASYATGDHPLLTAKFDASNHLQVIHDRSNDNTDLVITVGGAVEQTLTLDTSEIQFGDDLKGVISGDGTNISVTLDAIAGSDYATAASSFPGPPTELHNGNADGSIIPPLLWFGGEHTDEDMSEAEQAAALRDLDFLKPIIAEDTTVFINSTTANVASAVQGTDNFVIDTEVVPRAGMYLSFESGELNVDGRWIQKATELNPGIWLIEPHRPLDVAPTAGDAVRFGKLPMEMFRNQ